MEEHTSNTTRGTPIEGVNAKQPDHRLNLIHESQSQSQWFSLYKAYAVRVKGQYPHDSDTHRMIKVFEYLEGRCGNEAVFSSLVDFREGYYSIHKQVQIKKHEHRKQPSAGSIKNEIVKHIALNILDNAMSIVSQEEGPTSRGATGNGVERYQVHELTPSGYIEGAAIPTCSVLLQDVREESQPTEWGIPPISRLPRLSPAPDDSAIPLEVTGPYKLSSRLAPEPGRRAGAYGLQEVCNRFSQAQKVTGNHQENQKPLLGAEETESSKKPTLPSPAHNVGCARKNRASSNPIRQTRASMLRAEANKKLADGKPRTDSGKKRGVPKAMDRVTGEDSLATPLRLVSNGFEVGDPFTETAPGKISLVPRRFQTNSIMNKTSRDYEKITETPNHNRKVSGDHNRSKPGIPSENTQISITSSLMTTPGKHPLISRVDTVNAQLLREMSGGSHFSYAPIDHGEYVPTTHGYRDATFATSRVIEFGNRVRPQPLHESPKPQETATTSRTTSTTGSPPILDTMDGPKKRLMARTAGIGSTGRSNIGKKSETHKLGLTPANESRGAGNASLTLSEQQRRILGRDTSIEGTSIRPDIYTRLTANTTVRMANTPGVGTGAIRLQRSREASAATSAREQTPIQRVPEKKPVSAARQPRKSPTVESPSKKTNLRQPMFPAKKPMPLGFKSNNAKANQARDEKAKLPMKQAPASENGRAIKRSLNIENKAHRQQKGCKLRAPDASDLIPEENCALENPTGIPTPPAPLADISGVGAAKNPRPSLGRKWLGCKISPKSAQATAGDQKENVPPLKFLSPNPPQVLDQQSSLKSKKRLGIKNLFQKPPRNSQGSHFSGKNFLRFGRTPEGNPTGMPGGPSMPFGFSKDEIDRLKNQLKSHCPGGDGGMNTVAGRYYTSPVPNYDESPSRDVKSGNPIGVAMELIHAASTERDKNQSERMFQLSEIIVDAVTKSHEASAASEVAKKASKEAELANIEVSLKLRECVAWVQDWKLMVAKKMLAK